MSVLLCYLILKINVLNLNMLIDFCFWVYKASEGNVANQRVGLSGTIGIFLNHGMNWFLGYLICWISHQLSDTGAHCFSLLHTLTYKCPHSFNLLSVSSLPQQGFFVIVMSLMLPCNQSFSSILFLLMTLECFFKTYQVFQWLAIKN